MHGDDLSAAEAHVGDVGGLAVDVFGAHVHNTLKAKKGTGGGSGKAVLTGASFGDNAMLAHAAGEESLTEGIIDLVGAGVAKILPFEVDIGRGAVGDAELVGEVGSGHERGGAANALREELAEMGVEGGVLTGGRVRIRELVESRNESFGDVAPTKAPKATIDAIAAAGGFLRGASNSGSCCLNKTPCSAPVVLACCPAAPRSLRCHSFGKEGSETGRARWQI